MAKDKERQLNPAAAKLKQDKAQARNKALKERNKQRQEKLARRNPDRIQKQVDALKASKDRNNGILHQQDAKQLEQLEKDLVSIRKAKEALGETWNVKSEDGRPRGGGFSRGRGRGDRFGGGQRSRREGNEDGFESDASTSSSVADIPLPEGPPPASAYADAGAHLTGLPQKPQTAPALPATTTYESAPVLRNLKKEATRFVPAAIHRQKKQSDAIQKIRKDAEAAGIETSKLATTSTMMVNPAPDLIDTEYEQFQQEIGDEEDE